MLETRWERTRAETSSALHTAKFWLFEVAMFAVAGFGAGIASDKADWTTTETAVYTFLIVIGGMLAIGLAVFVMSWIFGPSKQRDEARQELRDFASFLKAETLLRRLAELRADGVGNRNYYLEHTIPTADQKSMDDLKAKFDRWRGAASEIMRQLSDSEATLYDTLDLVEAPDFLQITNPNQRQIVKMWSHHLRNVREFVIRFREHQLVRPPVFDIPEDSLLKALEERP